MLWFILQLAAVSTALGAAAFVAARREKALTLAWVLAVVALLVGCYAGLMAVFGASVVWAPCFAGGCDPVTWADRGRGLGFLTAGAGALTLPLAVVLPWPQRWWWRAVVGFLGALAALAAAAALWTVGG